MQKGRGDRTGARRPSDGPKPSREGARPDADALFVLALADALRDILRDEMRASV